MKYEIVGSPFPAVVMTVAAGETVNCQKGGMSWMSPNMEMKTQTGGLKKMLTKAVSGESMFSNAYTAQGGEGLLAVASSIPGDILAIDVDPAKPIVAQKGSYLASDATVVQETFFQQKLTAGFFGGEGFVMQKFVGSGTVFLEIDGSVVNYDLAAGQSMIMDTGYLAAMDATCTMSIEKNKGIANALFSGEGLFNTKVTGPGRVWIQTMPAPSLAGAIAPFLPTSND